MEAIDRLIALPTLARRAIVLALSIGIWVIGAMLASMHLNAEVCALILLAAGGGVLWSTGLWRLWKVFSIIVLVCVAMMR
jgi:hypothetical protein